MLSISHFFGLRLPRFVFIFSLSLCTFLMTILCYTFRLVQFQFSVLTTDCYLNDSIPFCSFNKSSREAREDILLYFKYIFNYLRTTVVLSALWSCVFCYSSLICPFSTWSNLPICGSASKWKLLKCLSFDCLHIRMCATANAKCLLYEPQRFHIIPSIMCCLFCGFQII